MIPCQSGQLKITTLSFSDTEDGACLDSFLYQIVSDDEEGVLLDFKMPGKQLFFISTRSDLSLV